MVEIAPVFSVPAMRSPVSPLLTDFTLFDYVRSKLGSGYHVYSKPDLAYTATRLLRASYNPGGVQERPKMFAVFAGRAVVPVSDAAAAPDVFVMPSPSHVYLEYLCLCM
jgi:hypothetical protein